VDRHAIVVMVVVVIVVVIVVVVLPVPIVVVEVPPVSEVVVVVVVVVPVMVGGDVLAGRGGRARRAERGDPHQAGECQRRCHQTDDNEPHAHIPFREIYISP
jgi:hypothetical protein